MKTTTHQDTKTGNTSATSGSVAVSIRSFDVNDTSWMSEGNCAHRDPSIFFPSDGVGVEVARRICEGCPVMGECLEYAIAERIDHGVWGGCSERERRRIIRSRQGRPAQQPARVA